MRKFILYLIVFITIISCNSNIRPELYMESININNDENKLVITPTIKFEYDSEKKMIKWLNKASEEKFTFQVGNKYFFIFKSMKFNLKDHEQSIIKTNRIQLSFFIDDEELYKNILPTMLENNKMIDSNQAPLEMVNISLDVDGKWIFYDLNENIDHDMIYEKLYAKMIKYLKKNKSSALAISIPKIKKEYENNPATANYVYKYQFIKFTSAIESIISELNPILGNGYMIVLSNGVKLYDNSSDIMYYKNGDLINVFGILNDVENYTETKSKFVEANILNTHKNTFYRNMYFQFFEKGDI